MISKFKRSAGSKGYTLVEILVAVTLLGVVTVSVLGFVFQTMRIYSYDGGRLMVNRDMRTFTNALANDCVASNYFRIYPDYQTRTAFVTDGMSGDFLILAFTDTNNAAGAYYITQLVGYYRDADPTNPTSLGPVRRFSVMIATADQSKDLPTLVAQYVPSSSTPTDPVVIQLAQGLSNGSLFYDYRDRSIMVRGQIVDYGSQGGRAAINTYNFTVSPRG
jgi:prepilin-type N-terminal cleavage/methylation domain-containing protein